MDILLADVNGDGHLDAVTANNSSSNDASILFGNGTGVFGSLTYPTGDAPCPWPSATSMKTAASIQ